MQIKTYLDNLGQVDKKDRGKVDAGKRPGASGKAEGTAADTVNFSTEGKLRSEAVNTAWNSSDMRAEKVARLKEQVATGAYEPDIRKAAMNLIRQDLDLIL